MKLVESTVATTHLDKQNEQFTVGALESMVRQINSSIVPLNDEHDPRNPPVGRVLSARLKSLPDGETAVVIEGEVFEPGEDVPKLNDGRELVLQKLPEATNGLYVLFDKSFSSAEDQESLRHIESATGAGLDEERKKSIEPLSIITLGAVFIARHVVAGFFTKFGEKLYDKAEPHIKRLFSRKRQAGIRSLLVLETVIKYEGKDVLVGVQMTDPSDYELTALRSSGFQYLDREVPAIIEKNPEVRRLVYAYSEDGLRLKYAVRNDGAPLMPPEGKMHDRPIQKEPL